LPTHPEHISQAERNERLAQSLKRGQDRDWAVTAIFYAAVHHIEAYFDAVHGLHYTSHGRRDQAMIDESDLDAIYEDYRALEEVSKKTRYSCKVYSAEEIDKVFFPLLQKIKTHIASYLR
jgi:hypothetical protein